MLRTQQTQTDRMHNGVVGSIVHWLAWRSMTILMHRACGHVIYKLSDSIRAPYVLRSGMICAIETKHRSVALRMFFAAQHACTHVCTRARTHARTHDFDTCNGWSPRMHDLISRIYKSEMTSSRVASGWWWRHSISRSPIPFLVCPVSSS